MLQKKKFCNIITYMDSEVKMNPIHPYMYHTYISCLKGAKNKLPNKGVLSFLEKLQCKCPSYILDPLIWVQIKTCLNPFHVLLPLLGVLQMD